MPLGAGGTGEVYLVHQELLPNIAVRRAIKFYQLREDVANLRSQFQDLDLPIQLEVANLARFRHENIISVIDAGTYKDVPYLVTEYVNGITLKEYIIALKKRDVPSPSPDQSLKIMSELVDAVAYLHKSNFFHCDIAPKNIYLERLPAGRAREYRCVLGDLGAGISSGTPERPKFFMVGTPAYTPEKCRNRLNTEVTFEEFCSYQPQWDLFGLSTTLFEFCSASMPDAPWTRALLQTLQRYLQVQPSSIDDFALALSWFAPTNRVVAGVPELGDSTCTERTLLPLGQVVYTKRIQRIIRHPLFARLKQVPQLTLKSHLHPSPSHTKFEHCLGSYSVMRRLFTWQLERQSALEVFRTQDVELGLLASLLFGLTAFPFSLAFEELGLNSDRFLVFGRQAMFETSLDACPPNASDDDSAETSLWSVISQYWPRLERDKLVALCAGQIEGKDGALACLSRLLRSTFDVRTLDYLRRDSVHLGVAATEPFSIDDILRHIVVHDGKVAFEQRGIGELEALIVFRVNMFRRMYWNSPNRALVAMLKRVLSGIACGREDQIADLVSAVDTFVYCGEDECLELLGKVVIQNSGLSAIVTLLRDPEARFYREICGFCASGESVRTKSGIEFAASMNVEQWEFAQLTLEDAIWGLLPNAKGSYIPAIVDAPVIGHVNGKLGADVDVFDRDGRLVALSGLSPVVSGVERSVKDVLQMCRVFVHPDLWDEFRGTVQRGQIVEAALSALEKAQRWQA